MVLLTEVEIYFAAPFSMGGSVSGEHGVGVGKIAHICEEHGEDHMNIQRAVKRALDPTNIMNPGKVNNLLKNIYKKPIHIY